MASLNSIYNQLMNKEILEKKETCVRKNKYRYYEHDELLYKNTITKGLYKFFL